MRHITAPPDGRAHVGKVAPDRPPEAVAAASVEPPTGAHAAWDWPRTVPAKTPSWRRVRWLGLLQMALAALLAGLLDRFGLQLLAGIVLTVGTLLGGAALLSPARAHPALQRLLRAFGRGVGQLVTWLLLVPLFYLVFTPFGLLTRRGRRDPMARRLDRAATSYWLERPTGAQAPEQYERQF